MNKLDAKTRAQILRCLVEGNSIRGTARLCDVSKNTVTSLLVQAGKVAEAHHDRVVRNLNSQRVQADEIWSFVYSKQKNVETAKAAPAWAGDVWTWTAIDADSKLAISWLVGSRSAEYAHEFMHDVAKRIATRVQMTTDGLKLYLEAVESAFGAEVDYATLEKVFGTDPNAPRGRYSPPVCNGAKKRRIEGRPDEAHVSTSYVERQNLTMRMHMRRFTRLTNAFSKKIENHAHAVALHFFFYNFCRIHQSLKISPAMAAGVTDKLMDIDDLVKLIEEVESKPGPRGPYKTRNK